MQPLLIIQHRAFACIALMIMAVSGIVHSAHAASTDEYTVEVNKGKLLHLSHSASSVIVADPDIADVQVVSPSVIYINGKKTGETSILAVDTQNNEILNATVTVTHNISKLNKALKTMMPDADVQLSSVDGALVMNGTAESPLEAEEIKRIATPFLKQSETLVNMLKTRNADQVMLKVRVAEVSRDELKRFGINLQALLSAGNFVFNIADGRDIRNSTTGALTRNANDSSLFGSFSDGTQSIDSVIDALQTDGLITILAEPNLTTTSGKAASFLAGGEFPVPVVNDSSVSIDYKSYGVSLNFTPVVMSRDRISLMVGPEVSTLSTSGQIVASGFQIPALITRRAQTTVEMASGQTFAIAGLLQNNSNNDIHKFPGLGDLPVLGALFRSSEFQHNQTELVILVTPYIVKGMKQQDAKTPVDDYVPASDGEIILQGKLFHEIVKPKALSAQSGGVSLHGPVGYVLK